MKTWRFWKSWSSVLKWQLPGRWALLGDVLDCAMLVLCGAMLWRTTHADSDFAWVWAIIALLGSVSPVSKGVQLRLAKRHQEELWKHIDRLWDYVDDEDGTRADRMKRGARRTDHRIKL